MSDCFLALKPVLLQVLTYVNQDTLMKSFELGTSTSTFAKEYIVNCYIQNI